MASWHEPRRSPLSAHRSPRKRTLLQRLTRRPGGSLSLAPSASFSASPAVTLITLETQGRAGSGSSSTARGPLSADTVTRRSQASASRTGAPTSFGSVAAGRRGRPTTAADDWGFRPWDDAA